MLATILDVFSGGNVKQKSASIAAGTVNHASIRGILKAGFVEWKRIHYLECAGKQRWWGLTR